MTILLLCTHHVDVKLIEASEWGLGDFPQGEHEANSGEGALAARQRPHVTRTVILPTRRLHLLQVSQQAVIFASVFVFVFHKILEKLRQV